MAFDGYAGLEKLCGAMRSTFSEGATTAVTTVLNLPRMYLLICPLKLYELVFSGRHHIVYLHRRTTNNNCNTHEWTGSLPTIDEDSCISVNGS